MNLRNFLTIAFLTLIGAMSISSSFGDDKAPPPPEAKKEKVHLTVNVKGNSATISWSPKLNNLHYSITGPDLNESKPVPKKGPLLLKKLKTGKYSVFFTQIEIKSGGAPGTIAIGGIFDPISNEVGFEIK